MKKDGLVAGIDIGGTNIRMGLVTEEGILLAYRMVPSSYLIEENNPADKLIFMIEDLLKEYKVERDRLEAVSIGVPALINHAGNGAMSAPNLRNLEGVDLLSPIRKTFFCEAYVNKDSNLLMLHEMAVCHTKDEDTVVGIFFGTGIGNGVWVNGGLIQGKNSAACELGHIPVRQCREVCSCGNTGCMEVIASGRRLEAICRENFGGEEVQDIFVNHWPHPVLEHFISDMSLPIATEINIFNPDYVILGGGVIYMEEFPSKFLLKEVFNRVRRPEPYGHVKIVFARCRQETGVMGAARYAFCMLNKKRLKEENTL